MRKEFRSFRELFPVSTKVEMFTKWKFIFCKDETSLEVQEIKFSNKDIKRSVVLTDEPEFISCQIVTETMEIELILLDAYKIFRNIIFRRAGRCKTNNQQKDAVSISVEDYANLGLGQVVLIMIYRYEFDAFKGQHGQVKELLKKANEERKENMIIGSFLKSHKCWNSTCAGFSYLKCKSCLVGRYCNVTCQKEDFQQHRMVCDTLSKNHKIESWGPKRIEELISTFTDPEVKVISLSDFMKRTPFTLFKRKINKMTKEDVLSNSILEVAGFDIKSPLIDRIVIQRTYLKLLDTKKALRFKKKEAMKEVD